MTQEYDLSGEEGWKPSACTPGLSVPDAEPCGHCGMRLCVPFNIILLSRVMDEAQIHAHPAAGPRGADPSPPPSLELLQQAGEGCLCCCSWEMCIDSAFTM